VSVQDRCMACAKHIIGSQSFWTHPMVLLRDKAQVEASSVHMEIVLILTQNRCTFVPNVP
jgi:hypothetical protein